jgi:hypothetical protein
MREHSTQVVLATPAGNDQHLRGVLREQVKGLIVG